MKKIIWLLVGFLVIIAAVFIGFKIKIDKEITAKIDELNNNGFMVKHNQSTNYLKTKNIAQINHLLC